MDGVNAGRRQSYNWNQPLAVMSVTNPRRGAGRQLINGSDKYYGLRRPYGPTNGHGNALNHSPNYGHYGSRRQRIRRGQQYGGRRNEASGKDGKSDGCGSAIIRQLRQKKFYWYIMGMASFAGLIWQLQDLTVSYFKYETVTELAVNVPELVSSPAVSLCFPYRNMIRNSSINHELYEKINPQLPIETLASIQDNVTIEEIFELTPNAYHLISACAWKSQKSYERKYKQSACEGIFEVTKFFKQQYICYMFSMDQTNSELYGYDYLQNGLISPGMFYAFQIHPELFDQVDVFQGIIHSSDVKPRGNKAFPIALSRLAAKIPVNETYERKVWNNYFSLSYATYVNNLMKAPYSTDCIDYASVQFESQEHCVDECVTGKVIEAFGKSPFTTVILDAGQYYHMTTKDNGNKTINSKQWEIRQSCAYECRKPDCTEEIYVTKFIRAEDNEKFEVRVYVTNEPTVVSTFKEKINWSEFVIQALSCFGIWFGLSLYSFIVIFEEISDLMVTKTDEFLERRRQKAAARR